MSARIPSTSGLAQLSPGPSLTPYITTVIFGLQFTISSLKCCNLHRTTLSLVVVTAAPILLFPLALPLLCRIQIYVFYLRLYVGVLTWHEDKAYDSDVELYNSMSADFEIQWVLVKDLSIHVFTILYHVVL